MAKRKNQQNNSGSRKRSKKWCELCSCWVANTTQNDTTSSWDQHVNGIKHRRKLVSQKYFNNCSGQVVSIFEEKPSFNYTSKDPAYYSSQRCQDSYKEDDTLVQVLKQFQMELVHHLGVASSAYQNVISKMDKESVLKIQEGMRQEILNMICPSKCHFTQGSCRQEVKTVQDDYVLMQAGFPIPNFGNLQLQQEDAANIESGDVVASTDHNNRSTENNSTQTEVQRKVLKWSNSLKGVQLVALASMATDLDVDELSIPVQCSTDNNVNAANSAAVVVLLKALARNIFINKLVLRYVLDAGEIAQYAGRQGLHYNGQHRITTGLLQFAKVNSTVQHLQIRMPPGGFGSCGMEELVQVPQTLQQTAKAKAQILEFLFMNNKSSFCMLPDHVNQKIMSMANLSREQVSKRQFTVELEHPL